MDESAFNALHLEPALMFSGSKEIRSRVLSVQKLDPYLPIQGFQIEMRCSSIKYLRSFLQRAAEGFVIREFDFAAGGEAAAQSADFFGKRFQFFFKKRGVEIADGGRIETQDDFLCYSIVRCSMIDVRNEILLYKTFQILQSQFLPVLEKAGFGNRPQNEIAAREFTRVFKGQKIGFFLDDHNDVAPAARIFTDIAERPAILVNKKTALADFYFSQFINSPGKVLDAVLIPAHQIKRQTSGLAWADRGQFGQRINEF